MALHDFAIFKELFDYDFSAMEAGLGVDCVSMILDYTGSGTHGSVFNGRIRDRICALAKSLGQTKDAEEFKLP